MWWLCLNNKTVNLIVKTIKWESSRNFHTATQNHRAVWLIWERNSIVTFLQRKFICQLQLSHPLLSETPIQEPMQFSCSLWNRKQTFIVLHHMLSPHKPRHFLQFSDLLNILEKSMVVLTFFCSGIQQSVRIELAYIIIFVYKKALVAFKSGNGYIQSTLAKDLIKITQKKISTG